MDFIFTAGCLLHHKFFQVSHLIFLNTNFRLVYLKIPNGTYPSLSVFISRMFKNQFKFLIQIYLTNIYFYSQFQTAFSDFSLKISFSLSAIMQNSCDYNLSNSPHTVHNFYLPVYILAVSMPHLQTPFLM